MYGMANAQDIVRVCASIHLDHSKRITCQAEHDLANHYDEVSSRHAYNDSSMV